MNRRTGSDGREENLAGSSPSAVGSDRRLDAVNQVSQSGAAAFDGLGGGDAPPASPPNYSSGSSKCIAILSEKFSMKYDRSASISGPSLLPRIEIPEMDIVDAVMNSGAPLLMLGAEGDAPETARIICVEASIAGALPRRCWAQIRNGVIQRIAIDVIDDGRNFCQVQAVGHRVNGSVNQELALVDLENSVVSPETQDGASGALRIRSNSASDAGEMSDRTNLPSKRTRNNVGVETFVKEPVGDGHDIHCDNSTFVSLGPIVQSVVLRIKDDRVRLRVLRIAEEEESDPEH